MTTYKALAIKLDSHPRAIGKMLNGNPTPIIVPCHRVVMSDRKIGGFGLGIARKIDLLEDEGIIIQKGLVDKSHILQSL